MDIQRVYIFGPMRGYPLYNFPAFQKMQEKLEAAGYVAVNPAQLDLEAGFNPYALSKDHDWSQMPRTLNLKTVIDRDLAAIRTCTLGVGLDGWEKSVGAQAESKLLVWQGASFLDPEDLSFISCRPVPSGGMLKPKVEKTMSNEEASALYRSAPDASKNYATQTDQTNPKDLLGVKKPPLRLLPWVALLYLSKVMALGAQKYGEWNWRKKKVRATVYDEAALRHLSACMDGQDFDEESGYPHEAHVMACMAIKLDARSLGALIDDRFKSGAVAPLIKQLTDA